MVTMLDAAAYIYGRYEKEFHQKIDEMKLQKMLYFAQREALIQTDEPLFSDTFNGWKYGPVMKAVRAPYKDGGLSYEVSAEAAAAMKDVMDRVFRDYAAKDSMSLSRLTHGEESWQNSRQGISWTENSDNEMKTEDIRLDAQRMKDRRAALAMLFPEEAAK